MATYYLSNSGNDNNNGLSESTAWASIAKLATQQLQAGDIVRFRKGDTFYGVLGAALLRPTWALGNRRVTFASYGTGQRPIISAAKIIKSTAWTLDSANVWKVLINDVAAVDGYNTLTGVSGANIGFLRVDGVIHGAKKFAKADLSAQWEFYSDEASYLYVYSTANPNTLASEILAAPNAQFCREHSGARYCGLEFRDCGGHGVSSTQTDVDVWGCVFSGIGGSRLVGYSNPTTRYGNGAECWLGSKRIDIRGNWFIDIYDVACTMQGTGLNSAEKGWDDITFRQNRMVRCNQVFETWATYDNGGTVNPTPAGSGFRRCAFEHNEAWDTGYGWSNSVRPDQNTRSPILLYSMHAAVNDISIRHNRFHGFKGALIYRHGNTPGLPTGFVFDENVAVFDGPDHLIQFGNAYTASQWDAYVAAASSIGERNSASVMGQASDLHSAVTSLFAVSSSGAAADSANFESAAEAAAQLGLARAVADSAVQNAAVETLFVTATDAAMWAPLVDVTITNAFSRFDAVFAYGVGGDSDPNRGGIGFLNVQLVPNAELTGLAYCGLDIAPMMNSVTLPTSMFAAVVTGGDGATLTVRILVNIGRDSYLSMSLAALNVIKGNRATYAMLNKAAIGALPAGAVTYSSTVNLAYSLRATTGGTAPATTPVRAGERYLDTTSKRSWQAFGSSSSADWLPDQPTHGAGAPGSAPKRIGDLYFDTSAKVTYRAFGTASSSDWVIEGAYSPILAYETNITNTVDATQWAPLLTVTLSSGSGRFDAMLSYVTGADSAPDRRGMGFLNLQLVPNSGLTGLDYCGVDLAQLVPFRGSSGFLTEDSFAVVVNGDGSTVTCQLLVNIGRDSYLSMRISPIDIIRSVPSAAPYTFHHKAALVTLPSGTVTYSSVKNTSTGILTGSAAPATTPPRVGAVFLDTTNKKEYRAFGTASSADWVVLN